MPHISPISSHEEEKRIRQAAEELPPNTSPKTFLGSPGWDYEGFLSCVCNILKTQINTAVYVHCQLGADRTGAFHIGYLIKTRGLSLEEASKEADSSTSAGPPNADYQRLVEAYAKEVESSNR